MQLRAGGYYRRRDGNVVGPLVANAHHPLGMPLYSWRCETDVWSSTGAFDCSTPEPNALDLVAEVYVTDSEPSDVRVVGAALLDNRGTTPTRNGRYLCYVKRPRNPRIKPVVLVWHNRHWYGLAQPHYNDRIVLTWCGPLPQLEQEP